MAYVAMMEYLWIYSKFCKNSNKELSDCNKYFLNLCVVPFPGATTGTVSHIRDFQSAGLWPF